MFLAAAMLAASREAMPTTIVSLVPPASTGGSQPRWRDIADNAYAAAYRNSFDYADAVAQLSYEECGTTFKARLVADGLKPYFAYQLKFIASHDSPGMERLGYIGRWWWEGGPLNVPDASYEANKGNPGLSSFLVFDYAVTDSQGHLEKEVVLDSSYHVLWRYGISGVPGVRLPGPDDGFSVDTLVDVGSALGAAYDFDYAPFLVSVFGEHEATAGNARPLPGELEMSPGEYQLEFVMTEESFHGSGVVDGWWMPALVSPPGQMVSFTVVPEPTSSFLVLLGLALLRVRRDRAG